MKHVVCKMARYMIKVKLEKSMRSLMHITPETIKFLALLLCFAFFIDFKFFF
jgi:hypothetical protein